MGCLCSQQKSQNFQDQTLIIESLTEIKQDDDFMIMEIKLIKPKFLNYQLDREKLIQTSKPFRDQKSSQEEFVLNPRRKLKGILKQHNKYQKKRACSCDQAKCVRFNLIQQDEESERQNLVKLQKLLNKKTILQQKLK